MSALPEITAATLAGVVIGWTARGHLTRRPPPAHRRTRTPARHIVTVRRDDRRRHVRDDDLLDDAVAAALAHLDDVVSRRAEREP